MVGRLGHFPVRLRLPVDDVVLTRESQRNLCGRPKIPKWKELGEQQKEKIKARTANILRHLDLTAGDTIRPETNSNDFGGFWNLLEDSNSNFVVAKIIFFEGFEFLVCSCECAVACLCPRNSISNVVASAIHDERNFHFNETIVEGLANRSLNWVLSDKKQVKH